MAFDTQNFIRTAQQQGYTPQQIDRFLNSREGKALQRTGVKKWLMGTETGPRATLSAVGNVMSVPSYAVGGAIKGLGEGDTNLFRRAGEGIRRKQEVMRELPTAIGVDPDSMAGKAIGFGGELLVPDFGDAFAVARGAGLFGRAAREGIGEGAEGLFRRSARRVGKMSDDVAENLLMKSYKLNRTNIDRIAEAIGATRESTKAQKVLNYLEGLGLQGSSPRSLRRLEDLISETGEQFNKLARTGKKIDRQQYIEELLNEAIKQENVNTPITRKLAEKLFEEAEEQQKLLSRGVPFTDTDLSNLTSKLWSQTSESAIGDPSTSRFSKYLAKSAQRARENVAPGSIKTGRVLRGLKQTTRELGKQAHTGLGTQVFNAFKPGFAGAGSGAIYSALSGSNPALSMTAGAVGGILSKNPTAINLAGKGIKAARKASGKLGPRVGRTINRSVRKAVKGVTSKPARVLSRRALTAKPKKTTNIKTRGKRPKYQSKVSMRNLSI